MNNGYLRVGAAVPEMFPGGIFYNAQSIKKMIVELNAEGVEIAVFPEMCLYGSAYSSNTALNTVVSECEKALLEIANFTKNRKVLSAIGLPLRVEDKILNCVAMVGMGKIWSIIYKNEHNQKMHFGEITLGDYMIPFGDNAVIRSTSALPINISIIIGSTLFPYNNCANIVLNPYSADLDTANDTDYIRIMSKTPYRAIVSVCGTLFKSPFPDKNAVIAECGQTLAQMTDKPYIFADIDIERIIGLRTLHGVQAFYDNTFMEIPIEDNTPIKNLRKYFRLPYTDVQDYNRIYNRLVDNLYTVMKNTKKRLALEQKQHFWLLLSIIFDMCKKYLINPKDIAVLMFEKNTAGNNIIDSLGFHVELIPIENISDNLKNAAILDWAQKNSAILLGCYDRGDYLMHNIKSQDCVNLLINFNKTFLYALLENRRKYDQSWAEILSYNQIDINDILTDFFIFHYLDNGLSAEKVKRIAYQTFDDVPESKIQEQWNRLIDRL